jgi:hypothetical protein
MSPKTNRKKNRKKTKGTKKYFGGKKYKHRRVGLFCKPTNTEYPIICNVCGNNNYIERLSTLGKSKENQVIMAIFTGDTFDDINNISIKTYFCFICGMAKILRGDREYIYTKEYKSQ